MKIELKAGVVTLLMLGVATLLLLQRQENQCLMVETDALRHQIEQASALRTENLRLTGQLRNATQTSQADRAELIPLRAQAARLHQLELENAKLKSGRQRMANQVTQAHPAVALSAPPQPSGECPKCHHAVTGGLTLMEGTDLQGRRIDFRAVFNGKCIPCGVDLVADVSKPGSDFHDKISWQLKP